MILVTVTQMPCECSMGPYWTDKMVVSFDPTSYYRGGSGKEFTSQSHFSGIHTTNFSLVKVQSPFCTLSHVLAEQKRDFLHSHGTLASGPSFDESCLSFTCAHKNAFRVPAGFYKKCTDTRHLNLKRLIRKTWSLQSGLLSSFTLFPSCSSHRLPHLSPRSVSLACTHRFSSCWILTPQFPCYPLLGRWQNNLAGSILFMMQSWLSMHDSVYGVPV